MSTDGSLLLYRQLADDLFEGKVTEDTLTAAVVHLPPFDKNILDELAKLAETFYSTRPRLGWAVCQVAQVAAASQGCDLFLQSLAAWHLGRACNQWTQPKRVNEAIWLARHGFEELNDCGMARSL